MTKGKKLLRTYTDQSPAEIRKGDRVTDSRGRTFIANGEAQFVLGDYHVNGKPCNSVTGQATDGLRAYTIDNGTTVTLTINEDEDVYA